MVLNIIRNLIRALIVKHIPTSLLLLFISNTQTLPATKYPPNLHWQQITTDHFIIVYHQGEGDIAQHVAGFVERVHDRVTGFLDYAPKGKTYIVLTDHVDVSNATAYPFPRNKIILYLPGPVGAPESKNADYLEYVFTHEYTHIVHINCVRGLPKLVRRVMGSWVLPNATTPAWVIEGIATYTEGKFLHGRAEDPEYDMMIRADILDGRFKHLDEPADFAVRKWPGGRMRYLYGSMFYRDLAEHYGDHIIARANKIYSGQVPYLTSLSYRKADVKSLHRLWREWHSRAETFHAQQIDTLHSREISTTSPFTNKGYYTTQPRFDPSGKKVYYLHKGGDHYPAIYATDLTSKKTNKIVEGRFTGEQYSLSPDGMKLYFSQYAPHKKFYTYSDLYVHNLNSDQTQQLTYGMRAFDPAISPDSKTLVFVSDSLGTMRIRVMDIDTKVITSLVDPDAKTRFSHPNFSPDGKTLVFSIWQGGQLDIAICDANGDNQSLLTCDYHADMHPLWTPDGRRILFYSDRTGVPNLFAFDVVNNHLHQVTNVATGVFHPIVSPDGKHLAMSHYSSRGYDIHLADVDITQWRSVEFENKHINETKELNDQNSGIISAQNYLPFPSLVPTFWLPMMGSDAYGDQYGIYTFISDILDQHSYDLLLLYGIDSQYLSYSLTYVNDRYFPTLALSLADFHRGYGDCAWDVISTCGVDYWERVRTASFAARFPVSRRIRSSTDFSFGLRYENWSAIGFAFSPDDTLPSNMMLPATGNWTSLNAYLTHSRLESYRYSISPEKGYHIRIGAERADDLLGGDFQAWKFTGDAALYLRSPVVRHVLALKFSGGTSDGDFIPQGIYHLGGSFGMRTMSLRSRYFQLRGYPQNAFRGRHVLLAMMEYRFPLFFVERGIHSWPIFWDGVSAAVFAEAGQAWQTGSVRFANFNQSIGAEVQINLSLVRVLATRIAIGYAQGFGEQGEKKWYFRMDTNIPYEY